MIRLKILFLTFILVCPGCLDFAVATDRLYMPRNIRAAYEDKTRSMDGMPGPNYWQNHADYMIDLDFNPETRIVRGQETIRYHNDSPDTLSELYFHLFPNYYKKGMQRDYSIDPDDEGEGIEIEKLIVNGFDYISSSNNLFITQTHTLMKVRLVDVLLPGKYLEADVSWQYRLNENSHMRTGVVDSTSFFIAYFYPRIAVYDDIDGWNKFYYTGTAEFYNDFGDFEVKIKVPERYVVWATGILKNSAEVLEETYLERYRLAQNSDKIVHIIDSTDADGEVTLSNSHNTWHYSAQDVSDFAFGLSDHYLWDATSLVVDDDTRERRVLINAAYDRNSDDFYKVAAIAREAIDYMSQRIPSVPFPFPVITVFNGLSGMEYPMMVNDASKSEMNETIKLTSHEVLHSYFPFYVGTNETKYAWMDEGLTTFGDYLIFCEIVSPESAQFYYTEDYRRHMGNTSDSPLFVCSEYLKEPPYDYNSYVKAALFFSVLKDYLGDERYVAFLQEFINRWQYKHPTPHDLFFTLESVAGEDLDWLIEPWFFEFGYVDLKVDEPQKKWDGYMVAIENIGGYPVPVRLMVRYDDESESMIERKVDVWKHDRERIELHIETSRSIRSVKLRSGLSY